MSDTSKSEDRIIVVGAGLGGLAAACTLAARGHRVTLLDKNAWLGGKAAVLEKDGFRFDMGPTILTLPSVLRRIFSEAGRNLDEAMNLVRLDPQWRSFFTDGSVLDLRQDVDTMAETVRAFTGDPASGDNYRTFAKVAEGLSRSSDRYFFWKSVGGIVDTLDFKQTFNVSVLKDLIGLRMGQTVAGTIRRHTHDERVAQMLDHFTQYVGSAPDASPAVLCGIAHMQIDEGVWYPIGGTRAVPVALEKLARELGVEVRPSTGVRQIRIEGGKTTGVVTSDGEFLRARAVVSNSDSVRTYGELVDGPIRGKFRADRHEAACSGVVLYLGLNRAYDHLEHHNFIFSRDPEEEFDAIYREGEPAPDPTCYVCAPSRTEPEVAPPGGEALYVLVHTPYLRPHHDWPRMFPAYRDVIINKLKTTGGLRDIEDRIVTSAYLTPQGIHERYRVLNGAIYGLASHGRFLGAFKPANRSPHAEGLYLAGGAAHPGPGMPMVLMSGWIAADSVDRDLTGRQTPGPAPALGASIPQAAAAALF